MTSSLCWFMVDLILVNGGGTFYRKSLDLYEKEVKNSVSKYILTSGTIQCAVVSDRQHLCNFFFDKHRNQCSFNDDPTNAGVRRSSWHNLECKTKQIVSTTKLTSKGYSTGISLLLTQWLHPKPIFYRFKNSSLDEVHAYNFGYIKDITYVFSVKKLLVAEHTPYRVTAQEKKQRTVVFDNIDCKQFVKDEPSDYIAMRGRHRQNRRLTNSILAFNVNFKNVDEVYTKEDVKCLAINPTVRELYAHVNMCILKMSYNGGEIEVISKRNSINTMCYNTALNTLFALYRGNLQKVVDGRPKIVHSFRERPVEILCHDNHVYVSFHRSGLVSDVENNKANPLFVVPLNKSSFKLTVFE